MSDGAKPDWRVHVVAVVAAILAGGLGALLGPSLFVHPGPGARGPFVYTPPEGFTPADEEIAKAFGSGVAAPAQIWTWVSTDPSVPSTERTANISVAHAPKRAPVEKEALGALAAGMPAVYASSGQTWTYVRHLVHVRPDGGRVGMLEGSVRQGDITSRSLQLAFPEAGGTAIVTASFPESAATRWDAELDRTMDTATGVTAEVPAPSTATVAACAAVPAGVVFVLFELLQRRGGRARAPAGTG